MSKLDAFTTAYIEAALWSSMDEEGQPLQENYGIEDIHPALLEDMQSDCQDFQHSFGHLFEGREDTAGVDFWLTRNRHGAGFWDGDWKEHGKFLTDMSHPYGEVNLFVGDDGLIHGL